MSVLDLNGVADPAERKRLIKQANQEMGSAGFWKSAPVLIICSLTSSLIRDLNWGSHLWPGTAFSTKMYGWVALIVIFSAGGLVIQRSLSSERKAVLIEILRSARRCTGCGYPIDESPDAVCPECGTVRGGR